MVTTKICIKCHRQKLFSEFNKKASAKNGFRSDCRKCQSDYDKQYCRPEQSKQKRREYSKKYQQTFIGNLRHRFRQMKERCNNPRDKDYKNYGGRGVKCLFESADDFIRYVIDKLGYNTPEKIKGLQIDRIDNDGSYEKGNIRFITAKENCNNRQNKC